MVTSVSHSTTFIDVKHFHLFCGLGGGAKGFNNGHARVGSLEAKFRCIGGIDNDPAAIRDFNKLAGVPGTVLDLFSREQYVAFHGQQPPMGWREATVSDIHAAANYEVPDIVFTSSPCKGFSGLLSETRSKTDKYQALNKLTLRGIWLAMEAWKDDPVPLIVFENVPRIANRGRPLLDQIVGLLKHYGYAVAETTHDCGELGGLAQSRKRFLLVARHMQKVPPFLYEPEKRPLRAVGDVLEKLPIPGLGIGGPMHRVPSLQWKTWVRLAFVEAGGDWRSLNKLRVEDGKLKDFLIVPEYRAGYLGVNRWSESAGTVAGRSSPSNGAFSIADPRYDGQDYGSFGVLNWAQTSGTITSQRSPGQGTFSVSDPRMNDGTAENRHESVFRIVRWDEAAGRISSGHGPSSGGQSVADPRPAWENRFGNLAVTDWDKAANTVIAGGKGVQGGWQSVADPRYAEGAMGQLGNKMRVIDWASQIPTVTGSDRVGSGAMSVPDPRAMHREKGDNYLTGGHYGVVPWNGSTGAVSASACHDNGGWSVADPRLSGATDQLVAVIRALDGTWHRPFTTLELAGLQSLIDPEEFLELDGLSDSAWRERIGNAVPSDAAAAIASVMGHSLLLAATGQTFMLSNTPIWVRPVAIGLSVKQPSP
ncbi:MAG: DNA cytosine methyltransferase [Rhodospirillales bacterium]|nr:DNA cytosine methyltransferase [Rhodospirillales bacterium]